MSEKLLDIAQSDTLKFTPGTGYAYSNIGYMFARDLLEETTDKDLSDLVASEVCRPLGLESVLLAKTQDDFAGVFWEAAKTYDTQWVYHGCLVGTCQDAARALHGLVTGRLLEPDTLSDMLSSRPIGSAIPGRPWSDVSYAAGIASGQMSKAGRVIGRVGQGPFSVAGIYHFHTTSSASPSVSWSIANRPSTACAVRPLPPAGPSLILMRSPRAT